VKYRCLILTNADNARLAVNWTSVNVVTSLNVISPNQCLQSTLRSIFPPLSIFGSHFRFLLSHSQFAKRLSWTVKEMSLLQPHYYTGVLIICCCKQTIFWQVNKFFSNLQKATISQLNHMNFLSNWFYFSRCYAKKRKYYSSENGVCLH